MEMRDTYRRTNALEYWNKNGEMEIENCVVLEQLLEGRIAVSFRILESCKHNKLSAIWIIKRLFGRRFKFS
jgi:hypothetical protein